MIKRHSEAGFVAIFSTMIIMAVLLSGAVALGQQAFLVQTNLQRLQARRQSKLLAQSCMDIATLKITKQKKYALKPNDHHIIIDNYTCDIISLTPVIKTEATVNGSNVQIQN